MIFILDGDHRSASYADVFYPSIVALEHYLLRPATVIVLRLGEIDLPRISIVYLVVCGEFARWIPKERKLVRAVIKFDLLARRQVLAEAIEVPDRPFQPAVVVCVRRDVRRHLLSFELTDVDFVVVSVLGEQEQESGFERLVSATDGWLEAPPEVISDL